MRPEEILAAYSFNSLRTIARTRNYPLAHLRRPELVTALADRAFDPDDLRQIIATLTPNERATLQAVVDGGGRLPAATLAHTLIDEGVAEMSGPHRSRETIDRIAPTTRRFDELCARLTAYGLLFSEPSTTSTAQGAYDLSPGAVVFVPGPVFEALRQTVDHPEAPHATPDAAPPPIPVGRLIVQPSYNVLLLPPLDPATLDRLHSVAEPIRVAEVAEFRLTQAALLRAVEAGETVGAIIQWIEARSEMPLPQNVRYTLDAWGRSFEQVKLFRSAAIVEAAPDLIDRLATEPALADQIVQRVASDRLLLRDATAAQHALALLDEIPDQVVYDHRRSSAALTIAEDGTITYDPAAADLLLPIGLRRIAEPLDAGQFHLVPERVRTAAAAMPDGLTGIVKWLRGYGAEVPPPLLATMRVWSLPSEAVMLDQPLLLHLPPDLLEDLRAVPEIAALLGDPYQRATTAVQIMPAQRDHLLAVLRAHGVEVHDATDAK